MSKSDTGWSEYWRQESADGEVFVSARGERHPALEEYWRTAFAGVAPGSTVLDIASGAGSIYASLPVDHGLELVATDISAEALDTLAERIGGVTTVVASADDLPFDDRSFNLVVSQFGIEYAGLGAFAEAARLVSSNGRLAVLAHIEDGYIDGNNKAQLEGAELAKSSGFIPAAMELSKAAFGRDAGALREQEQAFVPLIEMLGEAGRRCPRGVHTYLLGGFRQLYERRRQYDLSDITGWLAGMQGEVDRAIDRLGRMRAAALSAGDVERLRANLADAGLEAIAIVPFTVPSNDLPIAWQLTATRPD